MATLLRPLRNILWGVHNNETWASCCLGLVVFHVPNFHLHSLLQSTLCSLPTSLHLMTTKVDLPGMLFGQTSMGFHHYHFQLPTNVTYSTTVTDSSQDLLTSFIYHPLSWFPIIYFLLEWLPIIPPAPVWIDPFPPCPGLLEYAVKGWKWTALKWEQRRC
jgi:hypothetical protein